MRRCPVCEGILRESLFKPGSTVCRVCQDRLKENEEGGFEDDRARNKTIQQAHVDLLLAIYEQAVADDDLETWESYWLKEDPWPTIWIMLKDNIRREEDIRQGSILHIEGGW